MKKKVFLFLITLLFGLGSLCSMNLLAASESKSTSVTTSFLAGPLTLNSVPTSFDFGSNQISTGVITKTLTSGNNYTVSITDLRTLVHGYRVTVSAPILATGDGTKLYGNNIQMNNGTPYLIGVINPIILAPTVAQSFHVDQIDGSGNPIPTTVITASGALTGLLQWDTRWTGSNISMIVQPGEAIAAQYTTTVTWTLYDAP